MNRFGSLPPLSHRVCRLVLGTSLWNQLSGAETQALFDAYTALGGNCLDTALVYYAVESEIGSWMASRRNRASVLIHAKGAHHETIKPPAAPWEFHRSRLNPREIRADIEESLRRLQTDYLDIFTLHRDDPDRPIGEILDCLAEEKRQGRIRAYGASNWSIDRLAQAQSYAVGQRIDPFLCNSPNLALAYPNEPSWPNCVTACDLPSRDWHAREALPLLAWSPLALGFFSSSYQPWETMIEADRERMMAERWTADVVRVYYSERNFLRKARATELAQARGLSPTQIALAWVLHQGEHVFAVVGPRSIDQLEELFQVFDVSLTQAELRWLNLESDAR